MIARRIITSKPVSDAYGRDTEAAFMAGAALVMASVLAGLWLVGGLGAEIGGDTGRRPPTESTVAGERPA
ncbi:hypothetical protein [Sandarakinorhabdus rubra]|uniref:hypothetical protein n=1 Tax=Sandarakinorhabdus rubra TaxID=2672568 RepID=UPI0013D9A03F|nr:hypothetical protein [Sandarakinorhabdus rubra]